MKALQNRLGTWTSLALAIELQLTMALTASLERKISEQELNVDVSQFTMTENSDVDVPAQISPVQNVVPNPFQPSFSIFNGDLLSEPFSFDTMDISGLSGLEELPTNFVLSDALKADLYVLPLKY